MYPSPNGHYYTMAQVCELTLEGATQAGEAPVIVVPGLGLEKKEKRGCTAIPLTRPVFCLFLGACIRKTCIFSARLVMYLHD